MATKTKTKTYTIKFGPFESVSGHACDESAAPIFVDDVDVGYIEQVVSQTDVGILTCVYRKKVEGYSVAFSEHLVGDIDDPNDKTRCREFKTLKEARDFVRAAMKHDAAVIDDVEARLTTRRKRQQRDALRSGLQLVLDSAATSMPSDVRDALGGILGRLVRYQTSDGYQLDFDGAIWSDGDITFLGDHNGPVDHVTGERVAGQLCYVNRSLGL